MRFGAYIILLLSISFPLYYFGFSNVGFTELGLTPLPIGCADGDIYCNDPANRDGSNVLGIMIAVVAGASILVGLISGYSAIYIVPILILIAILNFFVFPLNFLYNYPELTVPALAVFNVLTVLASTDFIKGRV